MAFSTISRTATMGGTASSSSTTATGTLRTSLSTRRHGFHRLPYCRALSISGSNNNNNGNNDNNGGGNNSPTRLGAGAPPRIAKSARSRRKQRQREDGTTVTSEGLEWESFEFSSSPKWDRRFDDPNNYGDNNDNSKVDDLLHVASSSEDWEEIRHRETMEDIALQEHFERQHQLWENLDDKLIDDAMEILLPYIQKERLGRITNLLRQRTQQTRFLFENPANPSNVWACLRTLDSFGIQHVDVVIQSGQYKGKAALSQKRGMRTAMGSAKWLSLKNHLSTRHALEQIRDEGYHILCTDVNPNSKDIRDVDWDMSNKKICIVMGNEQYGISDDVKELADESFYLPMVGMAESFNLSVATAITCAHLSAASSGSSSSSSGSSGVEDTNNDGEEHAATSTTTTMKGPLRFGDISEREYKVLYLKGMLNSIKHKTAQALFRKHGIKFPNDLNIS